MSLLAMRKIRLLVHDRAAAKVTDTLQRLGVMELTTISDHIGLTTRQKTVFHIDHTASRVELAVSFLTGYAKQSFLKTLFEGGRVVASESEIEKTVHTFYYADIVQDTVTLTENINNAQAKLKELAEEAKLLADWRGWDQPLNAPCRTVHTETWFLRGTPADLDNSLTELEDHPQLAFKRCGESTLALTFFHTDREVVKKITADYQLETATLPARRGTPAEELDRIDRIKSKTERQLTEFHRQARTLSDYLPKLKMVSDYLRWKKQRFDTVHQTSGTDRCLVMEGWVPAKQLPELELAINHRTALCALEAVPAEEIEDRPPSEIENRSLIAPFESVTRLYGLPSTEDLDPSPYLAGFFFVFFGICLSDVGYGLVLSGLTAGVLYSYRVDQSMASFLKLLFLGGLSSLLAGLLFGGYFGIDPALLPQALLYFQQFNPISDPLPIFYLALTLGVIQLLFGLVLAIVREIKKNDLVRGLIENLPWLAFFGALGLWAAENFGLITGPDGLTGWLLSLTLISIVISRAWQTEGNIFKRLLLGILGLYGFVQYLSDTLSYSRLLALGLATSALAYSVNLIAVVVYETVPYIGWLLMLIVLVTGHLFNMVVNILSSFIHTARLQFVEFFGKFITGTGRPFRPFEREQHYTLLDE